MVTAAIERVTDAVVDALGVSGHPVGDHDAPDDTTGRYSIVYGLPGGQTDGSFAAPAEMATIGYQVESYGRSRQQCEHHADANRAILLATPRPEVAGGAWRIIQVTVVAIGGAENAGIDETGPLFVCRDDFALQIAPA